MNREQAVSVIKEIFDRCWEIEGKSLSLVPPNDNDALSDTFQTDDERLTSCIKDVAEKHNLAAYQEENYFVVCKHYSELEKEQKKKEPT